MSKQKLPPETVDYDASGCDYIKYWSDRQYEHQAEKIALEKLIPSRGDSILDLGGGYGRLTPLYVNRFERVTILDISERHLQQAQVMIESLGLKGIEVKKGDVNNISSKNSSVEVVLIMRVLHHITSPERVFKEVNRVLQSRGLLILEFPNKCNFKAVVRNLIRGRWRFCLNREPYEQAAAGEEGIFYNFHPKYIFELLRTAGFRIEKRISVSNLRSPTLKRILPLGVLVFLEKVCQVILTPVNFGPSLILRCRKVKDV
ncbi:methyltransferase domain-containing protein [Patescibacteria group bacterium]|nr:methyltransferase domain-containing protein [Patescibacteria group bacterium]MBU1868052.1 methyltransferase domain-containing protein [Patescibacteria group bacterium]